MATFCGLQRIRPLRLLVTLLASLLAVAAPSAEPPLMWVRDGQLTRQALQLLDSVRRAQEFGLSPRDFTASLAAIDAYPSGHGDRVLNDWVTVAASRFVRQLHDGRVDPRLAGYELNRRRAPIDVAAALKQLASAPDVPNALSVFEPSSAQYRVLKSTLARYRAVTADATALSTLPKRRLVAGDSYAGADALRDLLAEFGDGPSRGGTAAPNAIFDEDLAIAVARFQRRHGLTADGILGARTFAALTVPLSDRIRQIELTLERWRWLPEISPPAVIVNVPQFVLYTLPVPGDANAGGEPARIPVIVGESARQTPVFDSAIESVVFRPYWNVPTSILREELLPLIESDAGYLERHDMEIVRGEGDDARVLAADTASVAALRSGTARLRQRPGPSNALGLIKFVLPNPYSVYLHSTPEGHLFARERRALSHGCIRVSDASALAAYLLRGTSGGWDVSAIEAATCGSATFTVRLAKPVPIYILYGTVVVDTNGEILFFEDVYGYDQRLAVLLDDPV